MSTPDPQLVGTPTPLSKVVSIKRKGCRECQNTGYKGRIGVYELLVVNTKLKRLISCQADEDTLWPAAREGGTVPLFETAWELVRNGSTTVEEVISKIAWRKDQSSGES